MYETDWDDKKEDMRQDMQNHLNIRSFNNVAFDRKTSLLLLNEKLKTCIVKSSTGRKLKIKTIEFATKCYKNTYTTLVISCGSDLLDMESIDTFRQRVCCQENKQLKAGVRNRNDLSKHLNYGINHGMQISGRSYGISAAQTAWKLYA